MVKVGSDSDLSMDELKQKIAGDDETQFFGRFALNGHADNNQKVKSVIKLEERPSVQAAPGLALQVTRVEVWTFEHKLLIHRD